MLSEKKLGYLFIIAAMLIWGSIGVIVKLIPHSSELIVFYRVVFGFAFLLLFVSRKKEPWQELKQANRWMLLVTGITLVLNWIFFFRALKATTVASATISYYTAPVLAALLSSLILKEQLTRRGMVALALSFIGIGIMFFDFQRLLQAKLAGVGWGLAAAFFYALFMVSNKLVTNVRAQVLTLVQTGICILVLLPVVGGTSLPTGNSLILLAVLGIVHTALALVLYIKGLRLSKVQEVGVLSYLDPVSAIFFALVFLGEVPALGTVVGGSLVLTASYLTVSN